MQAKLVDIIKTFTDAIRLNLRGWIVVFCGALFYCYQFCVRVSPNIIQDEIMQHYGLDGSDFGWVVGLYYWAYSIMQIPLGFSMDVFGPRRLLPAAGFVCGIGCYLFASTSNIYVAEVARFMMGMGAACGFMGSLKLGTLWLPPKYFASAIAMTMVFGTLGAALGGTPLRVVVETIGWQNTYYTLAVIGAGIGTLIFLIVTKPPQTYMTEEQIKPEFSKQFLLKMLNNLVTIISTPQAWFIAGVGMLMYVPLTVMGVAWGVPFLQSSYTLVDEKVAASVVGLMFLGAALGSPVFTILSDVMQKRRSPLVIGGTLAVCIWSITIFVESIPFQLMYVLFFMGGFVYTAKCLTFASICEIMPRSISALSIGFTNMIVMTTGIIYHPLIGELLDQSWDGETRNNIPLFTSGDYRFALAVIPISLLLAILLIKFIKETHPKSKCTQPDSHHLGEEYI